MSTPKTHAWRKLKNRDRWELLELPRHESGFTPAEDVVIIGSVEREGSAYVARDRSGIKICKKGAPDTARLSVETMEIPQRHAVR